VVDPPVEPLNVDIEPEIWTTLGRAIERLEDSWDSQAPVPLGHLLPDEGRPFRRCMLLELIRVDQELRWRSGEPRLIETYLSEWPELAGQPEVLVELLNAECLTRAGLGRLPTDEELRHRFPDIASRIDLREIEHRAHDEAESPYRWNVTVGNPAATAVPPSQDVDEAPPIPIGRPFGRYDVKALLGVGGMGWVYHAYDTLLQRDVALKIPRFGRDTDRGLVQRFLHESRAAARIEHPHVCAVYDAGDIDGVYYITMRRVRGQSLAQRLQRGPLAPLEAAHLIYKLASALSAIHSHGILHRDIKTSNILLDEAGEPLLTDFGLARLPETDDLGGDQSNCTVAPSVHAASDTDLQSNTGLVVESMPSTECTAPLVGTTHYLAPELFRNQPFDIRSDVYGLGVVFYRMLAGRLPFPGQRSDVVEAIQCREPPPPSRFEPRIPRELEAICLKAMARQPTDRFQSAAEMAESLQRWLQTKPQKGFPPRLGRRGLVALAGAAVVLLMGVVIYFRTGLGTLIIDVQDPNATVTIDGQELRISVGEQLFSVAVGAHELVVTRQDGQVETTRLVIRSRGGNAIFTVTPPPPRQIASGWGLPRCDNEGSRSFPVPTRHSLDKLALAKTWSNPGQLALTGDIDGDGVLELLIGNGTTLQAFRFTNSAASDAGPELCWQQNDVGHLNLVADVTGSGAAEIIVSAAQGDRLLLRVLDGQGAQLKELSTVGEIAADPTPFNPKAVISARAVADLQQDGDKEIIAAKNTEGGKYSRGVVTFDYTTGRELYYHHIGPMVGDLCVGTFAGIDIVHGTAGTCNNVTGADGSVDSRCYVYCRRGINGRIVWNEPRCFEGDGFVSSEVGLADFDGDQSSDLIATSTRFHVRANSRGPEDLGRVYLLDPENGKTRLGYQRDFVVGVTFGGTADFDGNGTKDILVCAVNAEPMYGRLTVLAAEPGLPILYESCDFGRRVMVCAINDINGDKRLEVIVIAGEPGKDPSKQKLFILDSRLNVLAQWLPGGPLGAAIVSDLDDDGVNEIIVTGADIVSVLKVTSPTPQ